MVFTFKVFCYLRLTWKLLHQYCVICLRYGLICFEKNGHPKIRPLTFFFFFLFLIYYRKLCILKGIFPREPKKKVKGNHHTYYHLKDIAFLQHEPLLETFRELRVHDKKIKKAKAKKNEERAKRLEVHRPDYKLDRLIRERFVSFHFFLLPIKNICGFLIW